MAHNLARWTSRIGMGEQAVTTKTLRRRFFSLAGRLTRSARLLTLHLPQGWPWGNLFSGALERLRSLLPSDGGNRSANPILIRRPTEGLLNSRRTDRRRFLAASGPSISASPPLQVASAKGTIYPKSVLTISCPVLPFLQRRHNALRWIRA